MLAARMGEASALRSEGAQARGEGGAGKAGHGAGGEHEVHDERREDVVLHKAECRPHTDKDLEGGKDDAPDDAARAEGERLGAIGRRVSIARGAPGSSQAGRKGAVGEHAERCSLRRR